MKYDPNSVYTVQPDFRFRNDGKYVIAGYFGQKGLGAIVRFAPIEGVILTMFDGLRRCCEIEDICTAFLPESTVDTLSYARELMEKILSIYCSPIEGTDTPILVHMESLSAEEKKRIRQYRPTNFIVKPQDYKPNDYKLPTPASILWLLTNRCEVTCQYCYMHRPSISNPHISQDFQIF